MRIKTSALTGPALDWAVEEARGYGKRYLEFWNIGGDKRFIYCQVGTSPSTHWSQGGPIIESIKGLQTKQWLESKPETCCEVHIHNYEGDWIAFGPTPLIAAMRCYVASKLGDEVDVPEELLP